jgi:hypothetical protein
MLFLGRFVVTAIVVDLVEARRPREESSCRRRMVLMFGGDGRC